MFKTERNPCQSLQAQTLSRESFNFINKNLTNHTENTLSQQCLIMQPQINPFKSNLQKTSNILDELKILSNQLNTKITHLNSPLKINQQNQQYLSVQHPKNKKDVLSPMVQKLFENLQTQGLEEKKSNNFAVNNKFNIFHSKNTNTQTSSPKLVCKSTDRKSTSITNTKSKQQQKSSGIQNNVGSGVFGSPNPKEFDIIDEFSEIKKSESSSILNSSILKALRESKIWMKNQDQKEGKENISNNANMKKCMESEYEKIIKQDKVLRNAFKDEVFKDKIQKLCQSKNRQLGMILGMKELLKKLKKE